MSTITFELPDSIREQIEEKPDLSRSEQEAIAVDAYRRADISGSQVGAMLGMDYWETVAFLTKHQVYPQYNLEDLEQDRRTLAALRQEQS